MNYLAPEEVIAGLLNLVQLLQLLHTTKSCFSGLATIPFPSVLHGTVWNRSTPVLVKLQELGWVLAQTYIAASVSSRFVCSSVRWFLFFLPANMLSSCHLGMLQATKDSEFQPYWEEAVKRIGILCKGMYISCLLRGWNTSPSHLCSFFLISY